MVVSVESAHLPTARVSGIIKGIVFVILNVLYFPLSLVIARFNSTNCLPSLVRWTLG
jgi:hypothetical protein